MNFIEALVIPTYIAGIMGVLFYNKISKKEHPFVWYIFLATTAELTYTLFHTKENNHIFHITGNLYYLIETLLYLTFFYAQDVVKSLKQYLILVFFSVIVFVVFWIYSQPQKVYVMFPYQIVSVMIIVLAVNLITKQIWETKTPLLKSGVFLIGAGLLLVTTNSFFMETIFLLNIGTNNFQNNIFYIYRIINALVFLIDIVAIICLTKQKT